MSKTKILIGLATLTCAIAATTTPANAFFEATTPGATKGPIRSVPASTTLGLKVGGVEIFNVNCVPAGVATGFWNIQTSEEDIITKGTKQQQQPGAKVGPHEAITITNWGTCTAKALATEKPAKVSPCRLQVAQPGKDTKANQKALGSVQTDCVVEVTGFSCTVTIEQLPENHNIKEANLTNAEGGGVEIKANAVEFTWIAKGAGCSTINLTKGKEASFKTGTNGGEAIITSLQTLI